MVEFSVNGITIAAALPRRRILLTGASSGIGFRAALELLRAGHELTLPCRDPATAEATAAHLLAEAGAGPAPVTPVCDLADLASVETCAAWLLRRGEPIDALVLNAGLQYTGAAVPRTSVQGHELTIAVNHLGHQAMAQRLLPLLDQGQAPRVVVTASEVHDPATPGGRVGKPAGLGDLAGLRSGPGFAMVDGSSPFDAEKAYKDSKLCNLLFARELERRLRLRGTPMPVLAWSPGLVIPRGEGGFFRHSRRHNEWGQRLFALVARDLLRLTASPQRAGALLAQLAADPAHAAAGFSYRSNRVIGPGRLRFEEVDPSAEAQNDSQAQALWAISAELVGLPAELPPVALGPMP
jgi:protochlorophyllide reductase